MLKVKLLLNNNYCVCKPSQRVDLVGFESCTSIPYRRNLGGSGLGVFWNFYFSLRTASNYDEHQTN